MLEVRHGSPYDDNPTQVDELAEISNQEDQCSALQLDANVSVQTLEQASHELDMLIQNAKAQLLEIRTKKGTKNVKFMLSMFMDDCKLRREKIRRTEHARQLVDHKRQPPSQLGHADTGWQGDARGQQLQKLKRANYDLDRVLQKIKNNKFNDDLIKTLQTSLQECIEAKQAVHQVQIECLDSNGYASSDGADLEEIRKRWKNLRSFSIYDVYQRSQNNDMFQRMPSEDERLAYLVQTSDKQIDRIVQSDELDRRQIPTVTALCTDLLNENAALKKMCNTYQLKVLLGRDQRDRARASSQQQYA